MHGDLKVGTIRLTLPRLVTNTYVNYDTEQDIHFFHTNANSEVFKTRFTPGEAGAIAHLWDMRITDNSDNEEFNHLLWEEVK